MRRFIWAFLYIVTDLSEWVKQINRHIQLLRVYALEHLENSLITSGELWSAREFLPDHNPNISHELFCF